MAFITALAGRRTKLRFSESVERLIGIVLVVAVAAWLIKNLADGPAEFVQNLITGLSLGATYALIALGYTLVYGIIELINFAHGDLFMLGTMLTANMMVNWLGISSPSVSGYLAMILTMAVTMAFCALINVGAEVLAYRRLRSAPKLAPLITAIGLSFIFQNVGQLINGAGPKNWNTVFYNSSGQETGFSIGSITIQYSFIVILIVTIVALLALTFIVKGTRQGKAMRATAQDMDGARLMGINVNRTISFTFALGGAMAGLAATLYMQKLGLTRYDAGYTLGLYAFTAAVLGGIGDLVGAVLGGVLIGVIQSQNEAYGIGQNWDNAVIFGILIVVLVFKPEGILGRRTTEKV